MKKRLFGFCVSFMLLLLLPAMAEETDFTKYTYEELLVFRETLNETINQMERQYAIENGNRVISFEENSLLLFKGSSQKLSPSVRRVVLEAPEQTSFVFSSSSPEIAKVVLK